MSLAALRGGVRLSSLQRGHAAALGNGITRSQCRRLTVLNKFSGFDELLREKQSKRGGGFGGGRRRVRTKNGRVLLEVRCVCKALLVVYSCIALLAARVAEVALLAWLWHSRAW